MKIETTIIKGKALDRYFNLLNSLAEFQKLFSYEEPNDLAIVIVGGSFLDTLLENILVEFFPEDDKEVYGLFEYNYPLGTYSAKIKITYSLGLIEKAVKNDLKLIGKIRNRFAHDLNTSFNDENIIAWCKELKWHKFSFMQDPPQSATSRDLFQVGVNTLISNLHGVVSIARGQKRKILNTEDI